MYILGSMIKLSAEETRIPVPWWTRAPLGLETGTQVFVALTAPHEGRPGDLLVSVLNLNNWDQHVVIRCRSQDRPGVIEEVFAEIPELNIALGETITVHGGQKHSVELVCEARAGRLDDEDISELAAKLRDTFEGATVRRLAPLNTEIAWNRVGAVKHGWVTIQGNQSSESWREIIAGQLGESKSEKFDLSRLVMSGGTSGRLFTAIVPKAGAIWISIEHADEPGVLRQLAQALRSGKANILSSILKRGGASPGNAVLVAVCEPASKVQLKESIPKALKGLPQRLRADWQIQRGTVPEAVIYSRHPEDVVAHVPTHLRARVMELRSQLDGRRLPVFLSRRFLSNERARSYARKVREVLAANGCVTVEAPVLAGGIRTSLGEVSAAMWVARAGIVLGVESDHEDDVSFSLNLAHEFGFLQGQGKPLALLIEAPSCVEGELDGWSNLKGITAPRFDREHALNDEHESSLRRCIENWLTEIRAVRPSR